MSAWPDLFLQHFTHFFDKPFDVELYRKDDLHSLRLATFDRGYRNYRIYASLGLSERAAELQDLGEVILLSDIRSKDVPELLVNALFFVLDRRIPLGSHFAIGGIDRLKPEFAEYFGKEALYFTLADGFAPGFDEVNFDGETGLVFQAIFISWAEHDFLNRRGWQEFEALYKAQEDVDPCSLRRPSCV